MVDINNFEVYPTAPWPYQDGVSIPDEHVEIALKVLRTFFMKVESLKLESDVKDALEKTYGFLRRASAASNRAAEMDKTITGAVRGMFDRVRECREQRDKLMQANWESFMRGARPPAEPPKQEFPPAGGGLWETTEGVAELNLIREEKPNGTEVNKATARKKLEDGQDFSFVPNTGKPNVDLGPPPVPMVLHCPSCGVRHLDEGVFATKVHHTHACQSCGVVWRPAVVPTVGVRFLPGFKNEEVPVCQDLAGNHV